MRRLSLAAALAVLIAGSAFAQAPAPSAPSAAKPAATAPAAKPAAPAAATSAALIDINSAAKADLDALPGIGPARAEAIIKGRPYRGKDELARKKIIPESVYEGIKDRIIAHQKS